MEKIAVGIDFGTSGARAIAIGADRQIQAQAQLHYGDASDWNTVWQTTLFTLIEQIPHFIRHNVGAIAINGTSSTVLLCDAQGQPVTQPLLYNDARSATVLETVRAIAPSNHTVISATSSFAKLMWWSSLIDRQTELENSQSASPIFEALESARSSPLYFLHQADWLAFLLHGKLGISDYHNALKLGYDVAQLDYPDWLKTLQTPFQLPHVVAPGTPIGTIRPDLSDRFQFPKNCLICAGTTDSIAAFLASGADAPGEAITSLGSTLVVKLLSQTKIDDARYGIYSHRLDDLWLVGGASNTGGAVLRQYFSNDELAQLSLQIQPKSASPLHYYPLLKPGERFPINDPNLRPQLEPRPDNPVNFLHGLLESMARIEAKGYQLLQDLGATPLTRVYTAGGGSANLAWTEIRQRHLNVPMVRSPQTEAAYGTALLALRSC
jgi:D-ribulokinase